MIIGIGTDILKISNIENFAGNPGDPFIKRTYTQKELELFQTRTNPTVSYATRFAGKEAVFKSLSTSSDSIKNLSDIEILEDQNGQPQVILHGCTKEIAIQKKITKILISLSFDHEYAIAFATAVCDSK